MARSNIRNNELAQIHIAKTQLGLDDDTYRDMLWTIGRVRSSAELDHAGRRCVIEHLQSRGWKKPTKPQVVNMKNALVGKINALLISMKLTWPYADGIAKQMFKVDKAEWCSPQQLRGIVTALVNRQKNMSKGAEDE